MGCISNIDKAFENYFNNIKLCDELSVLIESVDDTEILKKYKELLSKVSDDNFRKEYDALKRRVEYSKEMDNLIKNINEKGAKALKSCKSLYESLQVYTVFSKLSEQLKKNMTDDDQLIITDKLKDMLQKINFNDLKKDIEILDSLTLLNDACAIDNIYLSKDSGMIYNADGGFFFVKRDDVVYKVNGNSVSIQKNFIKDNYISLTEVLANSKKEGKITFERHLSQGTGIVYLMYTLKDNRCICLKDTYGDIRISIYASGNLLRGTTDELFESEYKRHYKEYIENPVESIAEILNQTIDEYLIKNKNKDIGKKRYTLKR